MIAKTYKKGQVVIASTATGTQTVQSGTGRTAKLHSRRGIEIEIMNPRITNLGSLGVALVAAARNAS